jgi:hypothetical protein
MLTPAFVVDSFGFASDKPTDLGKIQALLKDK